MWACRGLQQLLLNLDFNQNMENVSCSAGDLWTACNRFEVDNVRNAASRLCCLSVLSMLALEALAIIICSFVHYSWFCIALSACLILEWTIFELVATAANAGSCMIHNYTRGEGSPAYYCVSCRWCLVRATPFLVFNGHDVECCTKFPSAAPRSRRWWLLTHTCLHVLCSFVVASALAKLQQADFCFQFGLAGRLDAKPPPRSRRLSFVRLCVVVPCGQVVY